MILVTMTKRKPALLVPVRFGPIFVAVVILVIRQVVGVGRVVLRETVGNLNVISYILFSRPPPISCSLTMRHASLVTPSLTCPPAARCARIKASLPGGRAAPTRGIIDFFFLPRFPGVGMTTWGITTSSFLSEMGERRGGGKMGEGEERGTKETKEY